MSDTRQDVDDAAREILSRVRIRDDVANISDAMKHPRFKEWLGEKYDRKLFMEIIGWLRFQDEAELISMWSDPKHGEVLADRFFKERRL